MADFCPLCGDAIGSKRRPCAVHNPSERHRGLGPCHVAGCDNEAVGGEIGEGGDLLLCADHLRNEEANDG